MIKYFVDPNGVFIGSYDGGDPPEGSIEVPYPPPYDSTQKWEGDKWGDPVISPMAVDMERYRRTTMGFVYGGKAYQTENQSQIDDILGKMTDSLAAITIDQAQPGDLRWSDPDHDFAWSAADGSLVPMDAQTCLAFTRAAVRRKTLLVGAGLALKAMNPIPIDYMDDKYWPPMDSTAKAARK
nr:hypothetical protein [uncultured Pseudomonas sp.]